MIDASRIGLGDSAEHGGSLLGSITAVAGTAGAIVLDVILSMGAEKDSVGRGDSGFTKDLQGVELIELFEFTSAPLRPVVKGLELAMCEVAKSLLISGCG